MLENVSANYQLLIKYTANSFGEVLWKNPYGSENSLAVNNR